MANEAWNFGGQGSNAGGVGVEQSNAILQEDPVDEQALPFRRRRVQTVMPEHRLLMAVLETALHCIVSTAPHRRRTSILWQEAYDWVFSDENHLFSFLFACEHLDIDQSATNIRRGITMKLERGDRRPLLFQSRSAGKRRTNTKRPYYTHSNAARRRHAAAEG